METGRQSYHPPATGADEVSSHSSVTQRARADRVFSRVPATRTAEICRSCDVLLN